MKLEGSMSTKTRRQYTEEFKTEAVRLVRDSARPVAQVARDLGIADHLLYRWGTEVKGDRILFRCSVPQFRTSLPLPLASQVVGSCLESCMIVNSARSVAQSAEASPGYCTPSRVSRQHVCRNSPGMIDQDRRHEVSGDRSYSELARSFRRRQKRW
ncbi:MAG: hypothetical protein CCU26_04205 [Nitrospira sp. UW-LDO-01]|nr:MAG: hypothetical protein CCU26_04205 [Nitrospira sp. UW-LDO-01]